jgi:predicted RNase H-like HicB family nuclease
METIAIKNKNKPNYEYFNVIIEKDEDDYLFASVTLLKIFYVQGKSLGELIKRITEAIELYLEVEKEEFKPLKFLGVQRVIIKK